MRTRTKKGSVNYVDNKELFLKLSEYVAEYNRCIQENLPKPRISNYLGSAIDKISRRIASRPNFSRYTYKDEMIADGIENTLRYLHKFDPTKSDNPFGYISRVIWNAFLRRIAIEKGQQFIKNDIVTNLDCFDIFEVQKGDTTKYSLSFADDVQSTFTKNTQERPKARIRKKSED